MFSMSFDMGMGIRFLVNGKFTKVNNVGDQINGVTKSVFVSEKSSVCQWLRCLVTGKNGKLSYADPEYPRVVRNAQTKIWELKNSCVIS
jgi:hypothetical protein